MNISLERLPECKANLLVEIPADRVEADRTKIIGSFARQAKIKGFRPGKAPKAVVEQRYQQEILDELAKQLVNEGCREGIRQEELEVLAVTDVKNQEFNPDGTLSFVASLTLAPEIQLPDYGTIPLKVPRLEVTDEDVDKAIDGFRERLATFEEVEGRELAMGDFAVISYTGNIDGDPLENSIPKSHAYLSENQDYWLQMKDDTFIPGFCEKIAGMSIGENRSVEIRMPEDIGIETIAGVEASYEVELKGIKEQQLPPVDDELAGKMFPEKTLVEAKDLIRENISHEQENRVEQFKADQIVKYLIGSSEFELPKEMVANATQRRVNQMVERGQMSGLGDEEIMQHQEEILNSAASQASFDVKTSFVLAEIGRKEEIKVTERDILQRVAAMAQQHGKPPKKLLKELKQNDGISQIRENILISKTLDFLKSNASVEEVDPSELES